MTTWSFERTYERQATADDKAALDQKVSAMLGRDEEGEPGEDR